MLHERIKYEQQHSPAIPVQGSQPEPSTEHKAKKRKGDKAAAPSLAVSQVCRRQDWHGSPAAAAVAASETEPR